MFGAIKKESRTPGPVFDPLDSAGAEEGGGVVHRLGRKTFRLNKTKAPFTWLDEAICLRKEKTFPETREPEYQTSSIMQNPREEDLI